MRRASPAPTATATAPAGNRSRNRQVPRHKTQAQRRSSLPLVAQFLQRRQAPSSIANVRIGLVPCVTRKDRRDHAPNLPWRVGVKNDPLEAAAIPRLDKCAEGIDTAFERRCEFVLPIDCFAREPPAKYVGCQARRLKGNRYARGKNRIEKLAGIAEQRKAGTAE